MSIKKSQLESIGKFFDEASKARDKEFSSDPILGYEQEARQKTIISLLDDHYTDVLDAGCGNGRDFLMLLSHSDRLTGVDLSLPMVERAMNKTRVMSMEMKVRVSSGDITHLNLPDNSFDLVSCSEVLEHVPLWKDAVKEFHRVLKPNGHLIVTTPNVLSMYGLTRYPARAILGSRHPYDRWKNYFTLKKALTQSGFRISAVRGICYLAGDLSYYQPFKAITILFLGIVSRVERRLTRLWPFKYLGYSVAIKGIKVE
jgi:SAM-dependent methyltransferase